MKRKQIYPYIFLTCLALIMVVVIIPSKNIFGSNTDWLSQHVNIADYLRQLILDNKSIFPDLLLILVLVKIYITFHIMAYYDRIFCLVAYFLLLK